MKKFIAAFSIVALGSSLAFAVNVDNTRLLSVPRTSPTDLPEITEIDDLPDFNPAKSNNLYFSADPAKQNAKLQEALLKIDSAQVDVKNELNLYESKLIDVKNRENLIVSERKGVQKDIRNIKKKLRSLDNAKKQINSNMVDPNKKKSFWSN